jgi:hypothetical protein
MDINPSPTDYKINYESKLKRSPVCKIGKSPKKQDSKKETPGPG